MENRYDEKLIIFMGLGLIPFSAKAADPCGRGNITDEESKVLQALVSFSIAPRVTSATVAESFQQARVGKENIFIPVAGDPVNGFKPVGCPKAKKSKAGVGNAGKGKAKKKHSVKPIVQVTAVPVVSAPIAQVVPVVAAQVQAGPAQAGPAAPAIPVVTEKMDWVAKRLLKWARNANGFPTFTDEERVVLQKKFNTGQCYKKYDHDPRRKQAAVCSLCGFVLASQTICRGHYLKDHFGVKYWIAHGGGATRDPKKVEW